MPKFKIEQLAINPRNPETAKMLLQAMGVDEWTEDTVTAGGHVLVSQDEKVDATNTANLSFNYDLFPGEFEVLEYTKGENWLQEWGASLVSHIGMHCTEEELWEWKEFFGRRYIPIVQEVWTMEHSNPAIKDMRKYHYCIFGTRDVLGCDVKFIVRKNASMENEPS